MSTKIQLTDDTWNPVSGCTRIAEGCRNCYAERLTATRLRQHPRYKGLAVMQPGGPRWSGEVRTHPEVLREPLRWRKPKIVEARHSLEPVLEFYERRIHSRGLH
jgi:protein gp37